MRVLLDENIPQRFRRLLPAHEVFTSRYQGWEGIDIGQLLRLMSDQRFGALITYDKALPTQQNLQAAGIGVVVILHAQSYNQLRPLDPAVLRALEFLQPGQVVTLPTP